MSIIHCKHCNNQIDTDQDAEHEEICGEESNQCFQSGEFYEIPRVSHKNNMTFHCENKKVGELNWSSGKFVFTGNVEKSGKLFWDWFVQHANIKLK